MMNCGLYQKTISINILSECYVGFHNIVVSNLFNCIRVNETAYVTIMTKLIIYKAGESRLTMGVQGFTSVPRFRMNEEGVSAITYLLV